MDDPTNNPIVTEAVARLTDACLDWDDKPLQDDEAPIIEIKCGDIRAILAMAEAAGPRVEEVREALLTIRNKFQRDIDQGYVTKDKTYAIEIANRVLLDSLGDAG